MAREVAMVGRFRKSFDEAMEKAKWFMKVAGERARVEVTVIKLLKQVADLETRRDDVIKQIGQRVYELRSVRELSIQDDTAISKRLAEVERIEAEIEKVKAAATELGGTIQ